MARKLECVLLIGLPGAGKSTLYREKFASTHLHVSKDLWPSASRREERQQKLLDETLAAGRSVVVDNTNPSASERAPLIKIARARGAHVVGYFFDVSTRAAVARNANRTGREKVPNVAIFTVAKRLKPPSLEEGFDRLYRVQINEDRSLRVTDWAATAAEEPSRSPRGSAPARAEEPVFRRDAPDPRRPKNRVHPLRAQRARRQVP